ncbi:hypothetical protein KOR42_52860 [Thalassoglobus neptunius]|uniref:Uncharacterized protein n=1 Tax=Thalassoglobus neptunius TaxID=1938619 RepID=A0A5C5VB14_9PLAN|nr:hypothetical protein [Thalassoglobus neptunius]TWT35049.1 hypothetical protein KOR42_52860 [Thalassoglobus neptunius]
MTQLSPSQFFTLVFALSLSFGFSNPASGQPSIAERVEMLPSGTNTITIVRLSEILETNRAIEEEWEAQLEERFLSGAAAIPPHIDNMVVGSLLHLTVLEEVWSATTFPLPAGTTMETIAKAHETSVESLLGRDSVRIDDRAYVTTVSSDLAAVYVPAHRQDAARWFRSLASGTTSLNSEYLKKAASTEGHVVMMIDLTAMVDPVVFRRQLKEESRYKKFASVADTLVPLVSGVRGAKLVMNVDEKISATLDIDFSSEVGKSVFSVKAILLAILDDLGASISELTSAEITANGPVATLKCELSESSFRQIVSLISLPPKTSHESVPSPPEPELTGPVDDKPQPDSGKATADYVKAINKMIDDLEVSNRRANNYERTILWHERFADRIDDLDRTGVSSLAIEYGEKIANAFRAIAASLQGQAVEVNTQQRSIVYNTHYDPGWVEASVWGGVGVRNPSVNVTSNLEEVRRNQAAAVAAGSKDRIAIWQMIRDERSRMSRVAD